jgi:hypothetical protein
MLSVNFQQIKSLRLRSHFASPPSAAVTFTTKLSRDLYDIEASESSLRFEVSALSPSISAPGGFSLATNRVMPAGVT